MIKKEKLLRNKKKLFIPEIKIGSFILNLIEICFKEISVEMSCMHEKEYLCN